MNKQGEMKEYVGCKIDQDKLWMKLTQTVMIQSFKDEYDLANDHPVIPAKQGDVMKNEGEPLDVELRNICQTMHTHINVYIQEGQPLW
jgi:hypothetical protein